MIKDKFKRINKNKLILTFTLGLMGFILFFVLFMQVKSVKETDITGIEQMRETELRESLANWKTKYEQINEKLNDVNLKIDDYNKKNNDNNATSELIDNELKQANKLLGKTDVKGEGIILTLTDNENKKYNSLNLLELVNQLYSAGAEAISINGQRIINTSDIVDIGNTYIMINSKVVASPYIVKVIGNQTYLQSALTLKGSGFKEIYEKSGYDISLESKNNIEISKFNGNIELKYSKSIEENKE